MTSKIVGEPPGPAAKRIIDVVKRNCYDSTFTYPLVIADGNGSFLHDIDGNSFLDFTSNIGSCPLGYSHPEIMEVLAEQSKSGAHKIAGQDFYCKEHAELSERVASIIPHGFKTFFINSGAEAVENAIKIAYRKMSTTTPSTLPGVSCVNAFHGRTLGALSFTFSKPVQKKGYPQLPVLRIKFCTSDSDPEIDGAEKLLAENRVAFILSEVVQGEGGYNIASRQFVQNLRRVYGNRHLFNPQSSFIVIGNKRLAYFQHGLVVILLSWARRHIRRFAHFQCGLVVILPTFAHLQRCFVVLRGEALAHLQCLCHLPTTFL